MLTTITHYRHQIATAIGATCAVTAATLAGLHWKRKNHPLVRYSQAIIAANPKIVQELGSAGRVSLILHAINNPADNEYGFAYKAKGRSGYAQVTVIGDYLTHEQLCRKTKEKADLFCAIEDKAEKVKAASENKDYIPVNIARFFIPTQNPDNEELKPKPIAGEEKIWRVKELIIETAAISRKLEPEDTFSEIVASEYTLSTYADTYNKIQESVELINKKMDQVNLEIATPPEPVKWYKTIWFGNLVLFLAIGIGATFFGRKPIATSRPFYVALSKAKAAESLVPFLGDAVTPLSVKGIVHDYFGFARFQMHLFGTKGEGTVKVQATKPLFGKEKTIWKMKKVEFRSKNKVGGSQKIHRVSL